jgi:hypothetical protein
VSGLTFVSWRSATPDLPGHARDRLFDFLPAEARASCWADLADEVGRQNEFERRDPLLYEPYVPRRERSSQEGGTASRSSRSTRAVFDGWGDPLQAMAPQVYVTALAGVEVPSNGRLRCPLPGHEDTSPSFHVYADGWHCFGCGAGGGIYQLGAAVYGLSTRGSDFIEQGGASRPRWEEPMFDDELRAKLEDIARDGRAHLNDEPEQPRESMLITFTEIEAKAVRWAWQERIALAKLTGLAGRPKIGKGLLYSHLTAQVTQGTLEGDLDGPRK